MQKQFHAIDICKLLMAICVVAIHTCPLYFCEIGIVNSIYDSFVNMAVPFFFLSSGFLLAQKFTSSLSTQENILTTKKYLLKIIKMYLIWTAIYLPIAIYHFISTNEGLLDSFLLYIRGFIFMGEQYNSWQLWYLLSTIYALIFVIILMSLKLSPKKVLIISSVVFAISIGINYLSAYQGDATGLLALLKKAIKLSIGNGRILTGIFYIPLGIMLARKQLNAVVSWIMFVGGYVLNVLVNNSYLDSILIAISTIGLFCVVNSLTLPNSGSYRICRKMSTVVYFIHMYVWSFYYALVYGKKTFGIDSFVVTTVACLIVAFISVMIMEKIPKNIKNKPAVV